MVVSSTKEVFGNVHLKSCFQSVDRHNTTFRDPPACRCLIRPSESLLQLLVDLGQLLLLLLLQLLLMLDPGQLLPLLRRICHPSRPR